MISVEVFTEHGSKGSENPIQVKPGTLNHKSAQTETNQHQDRKGNPTLEVLDIEKSQ